MIVVDNLIKRYGNAPVLDGVSFSIKTGESIALWGTNGAGKTTTLKCLLGLLPFEGLLTINGLDVQQNGKAVRTLVGYVPQEAAFFDLTVQETTRLYARLKKVGSDRIAAVLTQVDLIEHRQKRVNALSGGMKQRLALAISLLSDPPILLLDEPTANLDAQAQYDFIKLIQQLNHSGKTIIFSSHRMDEVGALAQRVLVLEAGKVTLDCTPEELATKVGLQKWLRIWVEPERREAAMSILSNQGYSPTINTTAFYVQVGTQSKMIPLRILESAQIAVQDFEVVEETTTQEQSS